MTGRMYCTFKVATSIAQPLHDFLLSLCFSFDLLFLAMVCLRAPIVGWQRMKFKLDMKCCRVEYARAIGVPFVVLRWL